MWSSFLSFVTGQWRREDVCLVTQWQWSARCRAFLLNQPEALPFGYILLYHYHLHQFQLFSFKAH